MTRDLDGLVERLEHISQHVSWGTPILDEKRLCSEAASAIRELRAEAESLRAAQARLSGPAAELVALYGNNMIVSSGSVPKVIRELSAALLASPGAAKGGTGG